MRNNMKTTATLAAVTVACLAGITSGAIIEYSITATIRSVGSFDVGGYDGASIEFTTYFDDTAVYGSFFGAPFSQTSADFDSTVVVTGASVPASNTLYNSLSTTLNFAPTFGTLTQGSGSPLFAADDGNQILFILSDLPVSPGASNALPGGLFEMDDLATGLFAAGSVGFNNFGAEFNSYELDNAFATAAVIPAPGAMAVLGLGGLLAGRRRR